MEAKPQDHILVGSFAHNGAQIMSLGRITGITGDREDSEGKKNENDEGKHN